MSEDIRIYTDGGCLGNPGPGAWAWVLHRGNEEIEKSGYLSDTTNNRMELTAVIEALIFIGTKLLPEKKEPGIIELYTDSMYVQQGITSWIKSWVKNGWKTASKAPVKNQDLWKTLLELSTKISVTWRWVKGHAGHAHNERANLLVQEEMRKN